MNRIRHSKGSKAAMLIAVVLAVFLPVRLCCAFTAPTPMAGHGHAGVAAAALMQQGCMHCKVAVDETGSETTCTGALLTADSRHETLAGHGPQTAGHAPVLPGTPMLTGLVPGAGAIGADRLHAHLAWRKVAARHLFQSFLE